MRDIGGAQAQVLSAAQLSIWARVRATTAKGLDQAIWKDRTLVRAWGMRRTMFLLPSDELAVYVRGTFRRSAYALRWAEKRVSPKVALVKLLDDVLDALGEPRTRTDLARHLKAKGYRVRSKAGGGWGDSRAVPWVTAGGASLPVGFLLHLIGARDVICSGPSQGNESTYVRAEKWLPHWKDIPVEEAERELLTRYLGSFGPATLTDFAIWMGLYVRDAKQIWSPLLGEMAEVEAGGQRAWALKGDIRQLQRATIERPSVRLLPFFDSFLLGHKSHRNIVDETHHKKVYRNQGWVSPVLLVDGQVQGVWSHKVGSDSLGVSVTPFSPVSGALRSLVEEEAADLGRFFGVPHVNARMG